MIFKPGCYRFKNEMLVKVGEDGVPFVSCKMPLSVRTAEIFDKDNWEEVNEDGSKKQG